MNDTFTIYQVTLTEAGFKETTIDGCTTWCLDINCPDGTYISHDSVEVPIYIELRAEVHYYSKSRFQNRQGSNLSGIESAD